MLKDIREMRERIEKTRKEQAQRREKTAIEHKSSVYSDIQRKFEVSGELKAKEAETRARISKAFIFAKFAGVALIFALLAVTLNAALKNKNNLDGVKIVLEEKEATELDVALAKKYMTSLMNDLKSGGTKALTAHWHPNADEEARFYGEEILSNADPDSIQLEEVHAVSDNLLKLNCLRDGHPVGLYIRKDSGKISLLSVN